MKIRPVGDEFLPADRRTDRRTGGRTEMTKLIVGFCLTVHHQLGKVIEINQLDATMNY